MTPEWRRTFELGFARDRVWHAWTDADEIVRWMDPSTTRVGDRITSSSGGHCRSTPPKDCIGDIANRTGLAGWRSA